MQSLLARIQLGNSGAPIGTPVRYPGYSPGWGVVRSGPNGVGGIAVRGLRHRVVEGDTPGWDPTNRGGRSVNGENFIYNDGLRPME